MLDLEGELEAIIAAMTDAGVEYALCGGLAMAVHGAPRATIDIDVLIQPDVAPRVLDAVAPLGYTFAARPMVFSGGDVRIQRVTKIDPTDGDTMMLDLLLVTPAHVDVWESRVTITWHDRPLTVVSREGLVKLKRGRSSAQDLADIERLTS